MHVAKEIAATTRELSTEERDGREAKVLVATRSIAGPIAEVWDALTRRDRILKWFLPVSGELKPGGRYQLEGNAGGSIEICEPPIHLGLTWEMHGQASWVDIQLVDQGGETKLRLEHVAHVPGEMWEQYGPGAVGIGWDQALMGLNQHFAARAAVTPADAEAWLASHEGRAFTEQSSAAWCAASIAAGADATAARAAAQRVAMLYSGDS